MHRGASLAPAHEPFVSEILAAQFRRQGITILYNTNVTGVVRDHVQDRGVGMIHGGPASVALDNGERFEVDEIVVATGRKPASDHLGLETVGVATSHGFVEVDDHLTVPGKDWPARSPARRARPCCTPWAVSGAHCRRGHHGARARPTADAAAV